MNLYEEILKRKSVRKYSKEKISEHLLKQIGIFSSSVSPLDELIETKVEILDHGKDKVVLKGLWKVEAPYYLVFFSQEKKGYEINAGYIVEQIVLYLSSKGLGSCYLGGCHASLPEKPGMKQVITIALGYAAGVPYRDPATAKRLPLKELCVFKEEVDESLKTILKAGRLAPSSLNSQPWRFIVYRDKVYVFSCRDFLTAAPFSIMRSFNIGIMLSHMMLAAEELWMEMRLDQEEAFLKKTYKNGDYVTTLLFQ